MKKMMWLELKKEPDMLEIMMNDLTHTEFLAFENWRLLVHRGESAKGAMIKVFGETL